MPRSLAQKGLVGFLHLSDVTHDVSIVGAPNNEIEFPVLVNGVDEELNGQGKRSIPRGFTCFVPWADLRSV